VGYALGCHRIARAAVARPSFVVFGPVKSAPVAVSVVAGVVLAGLAQRSRFCTVGGIRDLMLIGDNHLFQGLASLLVAAFILNLTLGQFHPGASPIAHREFVWNFAGMFLVGLGFVMLGGCPFRQMVMSGYGNTDSGVTVLGMLLDAGLAHNFGLAASTQGVTDSGKIAVLLGIVVLILVGVLCRTRSEEDCDD
jgi:YedE family putative selenium metabolism protein